MLRPECLFVAAALLWLLTPITPGVVRADGPAAAARGGKASRADVLRRARVWTAVPVERMNVKAGPADPGGFPFLAQVSCRYQDKSLRGRSLKFACALPGGDTVKVKVGKSNGEVFAEVAATRLLWALGFGADHVFPVRVVCHGCPVRFGGQRLATGGDLFDPATIERPMPGVVFGDDDGWAWWELEKPDPRHGGASQPERHALLLLAAFLQHTDNKAEQQRLLCVGSPPADAARCTHPLMLVNDLGLTFGAANLLNDNGMGSANLAAWEAEPVWKDAARCVANLRPSFSGTLKHPRVSDAGRQFLADLLGRLTERQLSDLFEVSRMAERQREILLLTGHEPPDTALVGGAPTAEWVRVFKQKRDAIASNRCR